MPWVPAAIGAVGAIGSALASKGGSSKGSSSSQSAPAPWNAMGPGAGDLWDDFMNNMYGKVNNAALDRMTQEKRARWEELTRQKEANQRILNIKTDRGDSSVKDREDMDYLKGWNRDIDAALEREFPKSDYPDLETPTLQDKMNLNYAAQEQTGLDFLDQMKGAGDLFSSSTAQNVGQYQSALDTIGRNAASPFAQIAIGGRPVDIVSKRGMMLADTLSRLAGDKFSAGGIRDQAAYDMSSGAANRALNQGMQFTPYGADMQYFDKLWPIISALQGYRTQTPSTTGTSTMTPGMSFAEKMNMALKAGGAVQNLWSAFRAPSTVPQA